MKFPKSQPYKLHKHDLIILKNDSKGDSVLKGKMMSLEGAESKQE
jgi:hypothetical protein